MSRRAFLKLLAGSGAAAASGVSAGQAAEAIGLPGAENVAANVKSQSIKAMGVGRYGVHHLMESMWTELEARRTPDDHMPVHIRTKKSWSPVFKSAVAKRERLLLSALQRKIQEDEEFGQRIAALAGLGSK